MLDTVVLTLENKEYRITDPDKFSPSFNVLGQQGTFGGRAFITCKQNPTPSELREGKYKPRLTATKRWTGKEMNYPLKIEFSAPKMLFGNNFDELTDKDFEPLVQKLRAVLSSMGVEVYPFYLRKAKVASIHYSKNFHLTDFTTSSMVISELEKIDLTKRLDLSHRDYRNEGHNLHYHANSHEVVFYDKVQDLKQAKISEKRSIEKGYAIQLGLFDQELKTKPFEVLRMEVRLGSHLKLKQMLKKIEIEQKPTFENLFKKQIARSIIGYYWQEIEESSELISVDTRAPDDLLKRILRANPSIKSKDALSATTALILIDKLGSRTFRKIISPAMKQSYWYNYKKSLKQIIKSIKGPKFMAIEELGKAIERFETIKLEKIKKI